MSTLEQRVIDLGKQRDQFEREAKAWRELAESRLKEVEALAVHVELLENEITGIINDSAGVSGYHMNGDIAGWHEFDITDILEQSPQTNLTDRDAEFARKAYLQACVDFGISDSLVSKVQVEERSKQYAQSVKDGEL